MQYVPYSVLKQEERAYEIMLLRDQCACTYCEIAKKYEISTGRAVQIYHDIKMKQAQRYVQHIALAHGDESTSRVSQVFRDAYDHYRELPYACAYLEKRYRDILAGYRAGEPGMPKAFIRSVPPLRRRLSKKTIARVVEMRERENASFVTIGRELRLTRAKAEHIYEMFYYMKVLELVAALQKKAGSEEERRAIWNRCLTGATSSKKRYQLLTKAAETHRP